MNPGTPTRRHDLNTFLALQRQISDTTSAEIRVDAGSRAAYASEASAQLLPLHPIAMEGLDNGIASGLKELGLAPADIAELTVGNSWLMVEYGATDKARTISFSQEAARLSGSFAGRPTSRIVADAQPIKRLWSDRETGAYATSIGHDPNKPDPVVGWEDAADEPRYLGAYHINTAEISTTVAASALPRSYSEYDRTYRAPCCPMARQLPRTTPSAATRKTEEEKT